MSEFEPKPQGAFWDATSGKETRQSFARKAIPPNMGAFSFTSLAMGGHTARQRPAAAAISVDSLTSSPSLYAACQTLISNTIGTGLTLSAIPDLGPDVDPKAARKFASDLERQWNRFANNAENCDFTGRYDFHQIAQMAMFDLILQGEILATREATRNGAFYSKVNLLSPMQCDSLITKRDAGADEWALFGVIFRKGVRVGYYLRNMPLGDQVYNPIAQRVPAKSRTGDDKVWFYYDAIDPLQCRGLALSVPGIIASTDLEYASEIGLQSAILQNAFAMTLTSQQPHGIALGTLSAAPPPPGFGGGDIGEWAEQRRDYYQNMQLRADGSSAAFLLPNDKLEMTSPNTPTNGSLQMNNVLAARIATSMGVAPVDIHGDFSSINFSAARAMYHNVNRRAARLRQNVMSKFYAGCYRSVVREALMRGFVTIPDGAPSFIGNEDLYCNARWIGPPNFEPDATKAAVAANLRIKSGISTLTDEIAAASGRDLEQHIATLKAERDLLKEIDAHHPFWASMEAMEGKGGEESDSEDEGTGVPMPQRGVINENR